MKLTKLGNYTAVMLTPAELDLIVSGLRELNEKHEQNRTMTRALKTEIIAMLYPIEDRIASLQVVLPESPQELYDEFNELQKLQILQQS